MACPVAEGEPTEALEAWGSNAGSPAFARRRRSGSSASLDSLDSASSIGSAVSGASSVRDYRDAVRGVGIAIAVPGCLLSLKLCTLLRSMVPGGAALVQWSRRCTGTAQQWHRRPAALHVPALPVSLPLRSLVLPGMGERPLSPLRGAGSALFRGDSLSSGSGSWSVTDSELAELSTPSSAAGRRHRRSGSGNSSSGESPLLSPDRRVPVPVAVYLSSHSTSHPTASSSHPTRLAQLVQNAPAAPCAGCLLSRSRPRPLLLL